MHRKSGIPESLKSKKMNGIGVTTKKTQSNKSKFTKAQAPSFDSSTSFDFKKKFKVHKMI